MSGITGDILEEKSLLVSPTGMVETPCLWAKRRFGEIAKGYEPH